MKSITTLLFISLILITISSNILFAQYIENPESFAQHPPIPEKFWVQLLEEPTDLGNFIFTVNYKSDYKLPENISLNINENYQILLSDNGIYPDKLEEDGNFTGILPQNAEAFNDLLQLNYEQIRAKGSVSKFVGHVGKSIHADEVIQFNAEAFFEGEEVEVDELLLYSEIDDCTDIKKENSLFITDLSVVEDPDRTYHVFSECEFVELFCPDYPSNCITRHADNEEGAWTFGSLMKNMAGGLSDSPTDSEIIKVREFLKLWLINLYEPYVNSLNSESTMANISAAKDLGDGKEVGTVIHIIEPWILRTLGFTGYGIDPLECHSNGTLPFTEITKENWKDIWDEITLDEFGYEDYNMLKSLLKNAPFKLSAIVNRLDLRQNKLYNLSNSGEIRFIFTLIETISGGEIDISPNLLGKDKHPIELLGKPPMHLNQAVATDGQFIDWQGMNVILEYGIPINDNC